MHVQARFHESANVNDGCVYTTILFFLTRIVVVFFCSYLVEILKQYFKIACTECTYFEKVARMNVEQE